MNWKDQVSFRVQRTGSCRRCKQVVTQFQRCPLKLPAPPAKPHCPMRE
jgi:hypothetical protein